MPIDDIGIGIRARIEGAQEGERLAESLQRISRSAQEVSAQKPGFSRWKQELETMDRSIDQWHAKIQRMRRPFGSEDVKEVEKYARLAKKTLRDIDAEHRMAYREKMRRLADERRGASAWGRMQLQDEIERTERSRERWEKEREFYRRFIEETEEEQREVMEGGPEAARRRAGVGILRAPGRFLRGAAMAVGAGLGIAGGMTLFGFLSSSLRVWMELDRVTTRLSHKFGMEEGSLGGQLKRIGEAFAYTDKEAGQFLEHYSDLTRVTDDERFRTIMGYSRWAGIRPEAAMQFGGIERLAGMDEQRQTRFLQRFETHLTRYGLQPMREQMIQTVGQIGQLFLQRVERISPAGVLGALEAVAAIGGGPGGPEVYRGPEALTFVQGLQQALGPGGTGPGRALRLGAYGYGQGTSYWEAIQREYQGFMRPENLTAVLREMEERFGDLEEGTRNLMYMRAWQGMGWGNITPDMVERIAQFTRDGGLEEYERYMRTQAPVSEEEAKRLADKWFAERGMATGFGRAGVGLESLGESIHRDIYTAQEFVGEKIGGVVGVIKEGLEQNAGKLADSFKAMATGDFNVAVGLFGDAVDKFTDAVLERILPWEREARKETRERIQWATEHPEEAAARIGQMGAQYARWKEEHPWKGIFGQPPGGTRGYFQEEWLRLGLKEEEIGKALVRALTETQYATWTPERMALHMRYGSWPEASESLVEALNRNTAAMEKVNELLERYPSERPEPSQVSVGSIE